MSSALNEWQASHSGRGTRFNVWTDLRLSHDGALEVNNEFVAGNLWRSSADCRRFPFEAGYESIAAASSLASRLQRGFLGAEAGRW